MAIYRLPFGGAHTTLDRAWGCYTGWIPTYHWLLTKTGKNFYPAHLSARSSRCCPIASTLYPSRLAHAYKRPRFIREQKLHIESQTVSRAACCMIPVRKKISNRIYCFMGTIASTRDGRTCLVSSVFFFLLFFLCFFLKITSMLFLYFLNILLDEINLRLPRVYKRDFKNEKC